eukprot:1402784-Prymnesium_polylepis.2
MVTASTASEQCACAWSVHAGSDLLYPDRGSLSRCRGRLRDAGARVSAGLRVSHGAKNRVA